MNRPKESVLLSALRKKDAAQPPSAPFIPLSQSFLQGSRQIFSLLLFSFTSPYPVQFFSTKILPFSSLCILTKLSQFF
ncbi:hypothetical protein B4113_3766 [Geobacillus sp. B4113_201601]|nr:hypothetical protein B4113_3766 [Geobacillus sp. B4113_201601]